VEDIFVKITYRSSSKVEHGFIMLNNGEMAGVLYDEKNQGDRHPVYGKTLENNDSIQVVFRKKINERVFLDYTFKKSDNSPEVFGNYDGLCFSQIGRTVSGLLIDNIPVIESIKPKIFAEQAKMEILSMEQFCRT
jgi:hypothetical protein